MARELKETQINAALELYSLAEDWKNKDTVLYELRKVDAGLLDFDSTWIKVAVINEFYSAGVPERYIAAIAWNIVKNVIPQKAGKTDVELVNLLAKSPGYEYPVFGSKFAHFFIDTRFPILDTRAEDIVKFHVGRKERSQTKQSRYGIYCNNLNSLRRGELATFSYKELDCYFWLTGSHKAWRDRKGVDAAAVALFTRFTVNGTPQPPLSDMLPPELI